MPHCPFTGDAHQFCLRHLDAEAKCEGLATSGNVQNRKPLHFRLALQDMANQPGHVVNVDKLNFVVEILLPGGKHAREPLALGAHLFGARTLPIRSPVECSHHVILDACSGKNVWSQNIGTAAPECVRAGLHHFICLLLMNGIGQSVGCE